MTHVSDVVFGGAVAFLLGVAAASLGWNVFAVFGAALVLWSILFLMNYRLAWKCALVFLAAIFAGIFYYHFYLNFEYQRKNIPFGKIVAFSATITGEPSKFENYQNLTISLRSPYRGEVSVITNPLTEFSYGELLNLSGTIEPARSVAEKATAAFPKIEIAGKHQGFWLKERLINFKLFLVGQFNKVLARDEAALLSGITFGERAGFSNDFKSKMSLSGTTHLVALSGYNITIVVLAVGCALGYFLSRRKTFYVTVIVIILFVLMVGAEASVIRAAIMGFLALLAKEVGRIYSIRNAIALTAFAMTIADPRILIYNVGFQLSFLSLLGIVYLGPALKKLFKFESEGFASWRENLVTTAAAQFAVMPLIIRTFGQFSLTAILANALILGFVPLTMFLGFTLAALSSLYFYLGFLVAKLAGLFLSYEIAIMGIFSEVRVPIAFGSTIGWLLAIAYYCAIITFIKVKSGAKVPAVADGSTIQNVKIG
jgi:competence protein ComEC